MTGSGAASLCRDRRWPQRRARVPTLRERAVSDHPRDATPTPSWPQRDQQGRRVAARLWCRAVAPGSRPTRCPGDVPAWFVILRLTWTHIGLQGADLLVW